MARSVSMIAVLTVLIAVCAARITGGWFTKEPQSRPKYTELAHYAVAQRVEGLETYDTVLELTKVETQIVAGVNYRLTFTIASSECKIGEIEYSPERCPPKDNVIVAGVNYRLTFTIASSECKIGEIEYSPERCPPKDNVAKATCTAVVYEKPWEKLRSLTSFNCE